MIKKLFDWTPRDIAQWEGIRRGGRGNFIAKYGVLTTGGSFFVIFGLYTLISWLTQVNLTQLNPDQILLLLGKLVFVAFVCLVAGVANSLITWAVEERLYRKYKTNYKE